MGGSSSNVYFDETITPKEYVKAARVIEEKGMWKKGLVVKISEKKSIRIKDILDAFPENPGEGEFVIHRIEKSGEYNSSIYVLFEKLSDDMQEKNKRLSINLEEMEKQKPDTDENSQW